MNKVCCLMTRHRGAGGAPSVASLALKLQDDGRYVSSATGVFLARDRRGAGDEGWPRVLPSFASACRSPHRSHLDLLRLTACPPAARMMTSAFAFSILFSGRCRFA